MRAGRAWTHAEQAPHDHVPPVVGDAFRGSCIEGSLARCAPDEEFNEEASDLDLAVMVHPAAIDERYPHGRFVLSGPCPVQIINSDATWPRRVAEIGAIAEQVASHARVVAEGGRR